MVLSNPEQGFRYWAFISYSSRNMDLAKRLHYEMENYSIPRDLVGKPGRDGPIPARLFPCFRDRDELPLASDLGTTLQDALRASRYLIVICTPPAAKSLWVNHEILYFKSLGRADRILALIADGEPNGTDRGQPELECFPPALRFEVDANGQLTQRRAEPIGGDVRPSGDGWRVSVLKAIAGITGLGLNAFVHRERKRHRRTWMVVAALVTVVLGMAFYEWDYNRVKITYYRTLDQVWGGPEGRGEISAETASHRNVSLKFESSRGKVRKVSSVNGSGSLIVSDTFYNASQELLHYREDGELDYISFLNNNNREVFLQTYNGLRDSDDGTKRQTIEFKAKDVSNNLNENFAILGFGAADKQNIRKSEVTGVRVDYDSRGFRNIIHFINAGGLPRPNGDDIFGQSYEYNDQGEVSRVTNLDVDDHAKADQTGIVCEELNYDSNGCETEEAYYDGNHQPVLSRFGVAKVGFKYDSYSNVIERDFFGVDGKPRLNKDHSARTLLHYDAHGDNDEMDFYGVDGNPTWSIEGLAQKKNTFDQHGNEIEQRVFGLNGDRIMGPEGCFRTTKQYDSVGNIIEVRYFGTDDKPVIGRSGFARATFKYNEKGLQIERAWFGTDDQPILVADGEARITLQYDSQGNLIEVDSYGANGQPILCREGYCKVLYKFGPRGNQTERRYFGLDGKPIASTDGYAAAHMRYDERGNLVSEEYFGPDGSPTLCDQGYFKSYVRYNDRGYIIEKAFLGLDDKLIVSKAGYAKMTWIRDSNGRLVPQRFDADGKLMTVPLKHP